MDRGENPCVGKGCGANYCVVKVETCNGATIKVSVRHGHSVEGKGEITVVMGMCARTSTVTSVRRDADEKYEEQNPKF